MTASGAAGGKSGPWSPWAAAAVAALEELLVIALKVSQGLVDAAAVACWTVGCGTAAGAAAIVLVDTATNAAATAAAISGRTRLGIDNSRKRNEPNPDGAGIPAPSSDHAEKLLQFIDILKVFVNYCS
jgi:hypothetical protein